MTIDELLGLVNIALGAGDISSCAAGDTDRNGSISIDEILAALGNAQTGCAR